MKCPSCLSTMICNAAIHKVPGQPGRERMDLHCPNKNKSIFYFPANACSARCHMGVITEDPKVWECHEYNFSFKYNNELYYLSSYNNLVDPSHQNREFGTQTTLSMCPTVEVLSRIGWVYSEEPVITLPFFIPLSTDNDMHEKAWELFHRLRNLIIYS